jgi:hypothetical protein
MVLQPTLMTVSGLSEAALVKSIKKAINPYLAKQELNIRRAFPNRMSTQLLRTSNNKGLMINRKG